MRLLYGLGAALLLIATGPLLMQWFKPKEVLVMNGLNTALLSLGIALSVSTAAPLSGLVGWQEALSLYGVVGVGGAAFWSLLGRARTGAAAVVTGMPVREIGGVLKRQGDHTSACRRRRGLGPVHVLERMAPHVLHRS